MIYAEIKPFSNECIGMVDAYGVIENPNYILVDSYSPNTYIGAIYNPDDNTWSKKEEPIINVDQAYPEPDIGVITQPTQLDRMEAMLARIENNNAEKIIDDYTLELIEKGVL